MIPKRMFFYFDGNNLSYLRYMTVKSFAVFNPTWEIVVTKPATAGLTSRNLIPLDTDYYRGSDYWPQLLKLPVRVDVYNDEIVGKYHVAGVSDVWRFETLVNAGGFYADTDVLFVKPMDEMCRILEGYAGLIHYYKDTFYIGFLASTAGNKFFADVAREGRKSLSNADYWSAGACTIGKLLRDKVAADVPCGMVLLAARYPDTKMYIGANADFYPVGNHELNELWTRKDFVVPPQCTGIHWHGASMVAQKANNMVTHENVGTFGNLVCQCAAKIETMSR